MTPTELRAISDKVNADKAEAAREVKEAEKKRWEDWEKSYVQQKIDDFSDNATLRAREGYTDVIVDTLLHDGEETYANRQRAFTTLYKHFAVLGFGVFEKSYDRSILFMVSWGDSE